ncbi:MAG: T9SS type A sorting domain-containing protein [Bacteroidia bacterium]
MKNIIKSAILLSIFICIANTVYATSHTWTGHTNTAWGTGSNWSTGSVPGTNDTVTIVSASNNPVMSANVTIKRLIMTSGTLDLNGDTLTISRSSSLDGGSINNGLLRPRGATHTYDGTTFGAAIGAICSANKLSGGTFNSTASFEDTTSTSVTSLGGCTFNGAVTIKINLATASQRKHANTSANTFNSTLTIINASTGEIQMSTTGYNYYNGNVIVTSTGTGGVSFGVSSGGTSFLGWGKTITIGSGGFTAGTLLLRDFVQSGLTAQSIRLTSAGVLNCINAYFNAPTLLNAPAVAVKNCTFNDSLVLVHTGGTRTNSDGGNIFHSTTTMIDSGAGILRLGVTDQDIFYGNAIFKGIGAKIQIGYGDTVILKGNMSETGDVAFANGYGVTILNGDSAQTLTSTDSLIRFKVLVIDKDSNDVTLGHSARVDSVLQFKKGKIISSSSNLMVIYSGATVTGVSDTGFVSGPVKKIGNTLFVFPVGKDNIYRPLEMSAPSSVTDGFSAEYYNEEQTQGDSIYSTNFDYLSQCDYWKLDQTSGSSAVSVKLYFKSPDCGIIDSSTLKIARWAGSCWKSPGTGTYSGNRTTGNIITSSALSSFGYFCFAYQSPSAGSFSTITPAGFITALSRDMQPDFNGYNGTNTITVGQTWRDLQWQLQHFRTLRANLLRYPGGTVANYWNWREGRFLEDYEMTSGVPGLELLDKYKSANDDLQHSEDNLSNFKISNDYTGSAPIFDLNIMSSDYAYQLAMLFHAKEIGLPVRYVELGNEFYNELLHNRLAFPSVADYAAKASEWAGALKSARLSYDAGLHPQVAVVGTWQKGGKESRQKLWLDHLMDIIGSDLNIDAITIHQYLGTGLDVNDDCIADVMAADADNPKVMFRSAFENLDWLKANEFNTIKTHGKKIWMTEFNMLDQRFAAAGSWAHALMVSTMLLSYLEEDAVEKVLPHDLVGDAELSAMFNGNTNNLEYDGPDPVNVTAPCGSNYATQPWGKSASGQAVALISRAINESTHADEIDFTSLGLPDIGGDDPRPVLYGWKFTKPYSVEYIILDMGSPGEFIDMSNIVATGTGPGYFEYLRAPLDEYITGDPGSGTAHTPTYIGKVAYNPANLLSIFPYSITRVVLPNLVADCSVMITPTEDHICVGTSTSINSYGITDAASYTWTMDIGVLHPRYYGLNEGCIVNPTSSGTYTVTVSNGTCTASTSITVYDPPSLSVGVTGSLNICPGSSSVVLTATCTGGVGSGYDYIWTPSYGLTSTCAVPYAPMCSTVTVAPQRSTDYIVYATDGHCWVSSENNKKHVVSEKPVITSITPAIIKCYDSNTSHKASLVVTMYPPETGTSYTYTWFPSGGTQTNTATTSTYDVNPGGSSTVYTVTITNSAAPGCGTSATVNVTILQNCCSTATGQNATINKTTGDCIATTSLLDNKVNASSGYVSTSSGAGNSLLYSVSPVTGTSGIIFIYGYFKVDHHLTFTDCTIQFGEQAEVHVDKGVELKFTACNISSCNGYTWRSIFVKDDDATVTIEDDATNNPTTIADADTALNLSDGAMFKVVNSEFTNNYVGIYLYGYNKEMKIADSYIYGNTFNATSTLNTPPIGSTLTYGRSGIALNHCENIPIGKSGGAIDPNIFSDLYLGIECRNSNFTALNNEFEDIHTGITPAGVGIYLASNFDYYDRSVVMGNSLTVGKNVFNNCPIGIYASGEQNITVDNNDFGVTTAISNTCLHITTNNKQIDVRNNQIENFYIGFRLYNLGADGQANINSNAFASGYPGTSGYAGTALMAQNPTPVDAHLNIYDNTITDARIGINAVNIPGIGIGLDADGNILRNLISFNLGATPNSSVYYAGIWLQHCDNAKVDGGGPGMSPVADITNNAPSGGTDKFRGIDIENSTNCRINCNSIAYISRSMTFTGHCEFSLLRNNAMAEYEEAIELFNANMTDQYQDNFEPLDNLWMDPPNTVGFPPPTDRVTGIGLNPIDWYSQSGTPGSNPYDPLDGGTSSNFVFVPPFVSPGTVLCNDYSNRPSRDDLLGRIVGDSLEFSEYEDENTYLAKMNAYNFIKNDTSILYLDEESDDDYQDFYADMATLNIGSFARVNELGSNTETLADARTENDAIREDNDIEYYKKTVNEIYLNRYAPIDSSLSSADSSTLESIAAMNWYEAGDAIYSAAAMLGLEIHPTISALRLGNQQNASLKESDDKTIIVKPNPAKDFFIVNSSATIKEVIIYDMQGNIVRCIKKDANGKPIPVALATGLYRINIIDSENKTTYRKLVVIR